LQNLHELWKIKKNITTRGRDQIACQAIHMTIILEIIAANTSPKEHRLHHKIHSVW